MKLPKNLQGRFEMLELIHETDSTEIWRVTEIATEKICVLRMVYRTNSAYKEIAALKHKNLLEIFEVAETEFATYVVEEFLNGENLADYIEKYGAFDEEKICQIGIEICNALEKLHERHIIHRDIKPENIFLTDDGIFKLIDFDATRIEKSGLVADTEMLGTPGYAAPEQYGFQQTDERTDIYSLGLTLKMLAGYEKYHGFLMPIFQKCASFDPDKRYDSAKDLKRAIIRSQQIHKWRKFFIVTAASAAIYFFVMQPARNENVQFETTPSVEKVSVEVPNIDDKAADSPVVESSSDFPLIVYPKDEIENSGVYERYTPPLISQPKISDFDAERIVAELTKKIDALNLEPPAKMPLRDFKNQMRNLNLSDEELQQKYAEYYNRIAMNQRISEFRKLLPKDLTAEEINAASMLFIAQEKQRFNLK